MKKKTLVLSKIAQISKQFLQISFSLQQAWLLSDIWSQVLFENIPINVTRIHNYQFLCIQMVGELITYIWKWALQLMDEVLKAVGNGSP